MHELMTIILGLAILLTLGVIGTIVFFLVTDAWYLVAKRLVALVSKTEEDPLERSEYITVASYGTLRRILRGLRK